MKELSSHVLANTIAITSFVIQIALTFFGLLCI